MAPSRQGQVGRNTRQARWKARVQHKGITLSKHVHSLFPHSRLKTVSRAAVGITDKDYGGRGASLNFPDRKTTNKKIGFLMIGFRYDTDQKVDTFGKPAGAVCCKQSRACMDYLEAVKASWRSEFSHVGGEALDTMRVSAIVGAETKCHTDAYRGVTHNYLLCHGQGCRLRVYNFPEFHSCVVLLKGRPFIPMGYSEQTQTLRMYGADPDDPLKAQRYEFRNVDKSLSQLQPLGRLPWVVVGIVKGKLQVDKSQPLAYVTETIRSPSEYPLEDFSRVVEFASDPANAMHIARKTRYLSGKEHGWVHFEAWKYRHEFEGTNPDCPRTHVYFRILRQSPTAEHYVRTKGRVNFISIDIHDLEYDYNLTSPHTISICQWSEGLW